MSRFNPPHPAVQHLTSEISRLSEQQTDALRKATFVGMTDNEVQQYDQRTARIGELVEELGVITSQKAA